MKAETEGNFNLYDRIAFLSRRHCRACLGDSTIPSLFLRRRKEKSSRSLVVKWCNVLSIVLCTPPECDVFRTGTGQRKDI